MFIICAGTTSDTLAKLCSDQSVGLGVALNDLLLTIKNRGVEHFDTVSKVIVTDGAVDSLLELEVLNKLAELKADIYFLNRQHEVTKTGLLNSRINVLNVDKINLEDIKAIIGGL